MGGELVKGVLRSVRNGRTDAYRKLLVRTQSGTADCNLYLDHPSSSDIKQFLNKPITVVLSGRVVKDFYNESEKTYGLRALLDKHDAWNAKVYPNQRRSRLRALHAKLSKRPADPAEVLCKYPFLALSLPKDERVAQLGDARELSHSLRLPQWKICRGECEYSIHDTVQREGHVCFPQEDYVKSLCMSYPAEMVDSQIKHLVEKGRLMSKNGMLYPPHTYRKESEISEFLNDTLTDEGPGKEEDIYSFQGLNDDQMKAVKTVLSGRVTVMVGPAGSGKTRVISEIKRVFEDRVILAAPTGKAARRMMDCCSDGVRAYTLHKLLGIQCKADEETPKSRCLVVVDEASMIDLSVMHTLVTTAREHEMRLMLVGDTNQLPSVGPGKVLSDLQDWAASTGRLARLNVVHRQERTSPIVQLATCMLSETEPGDDVLNNDTIRYYDTSDLESICDDLIAIRRENEADVPFNFQIISPLNDRVDVINKRVLQDKRGECNLMSFARGDVVICKKNYIPGEDENSASRERYAAGINGDVGYYVFDGLLRKENETVITGEGTANLKHANAITVHKSQGSEWDTVAVVLHGEDGPIFNKRLLYTAITRTKRRLHLYASRRMLGRCMRRNEPERFTGGFLRQPIRAS